MAFRRLTYSSPTPLAHSLNVTKRLATGLAPWTVGAGAAALLLLSVTPLVQREVLVKVPLLKIYYEDTTPASDKPF